MTHPIEPDPWPYFTVGTVYGGLGAVQVVVEDKAAGQYFVLPAQVLLVLHEGLRLVRFT